MDGCATKNSYARLGLLGLLGFESHPSGQESKVGHTRIVTWFETISNPPLYMKSHLFALDATCPCPPDAERNDHTFPTHMARIRVIEFRIS